MRLSVSEIAAALGAEVLGNGALEVTGAAEPGDAGPEQLALAMVPKYADALRAGGARAALLWHGADWQGLGLEAAIPVPHAKRAMSVLSALMDPGPHLAPGVHPTAFVDETARIGEGACIGAFAFVGAGAVLGARARVAEHVTIAAGAVIGDDVLLHSGVRVQGCVRMGHRIIAHSNATLGADGFSFVTPEDSSVDQVRRELGDENTRQNSHWVRVHSLGGLEIGDDVEIGACSNVDRGSVRATRIGRGTKIDNLVQIGHNVEVGEDCMICSQVGIAGSARIGDRVVLAGQVGINDNIFLGNDVVAGGASKIFTNVPAGRVVLGAPATKMSSQLEIYKALRRLPRLFRDVAALQKAVSKGGQTD